MKVAIHRWAAMAASQLVVAALLQAMAVGAVASDIPDPPGSVTLTGPVYAARASIDGNLIVVELNGRLFGGHAALVVVSTADPSRPRALVEMPLPGTGPMALSPDGRSVLLALDVTARGHIGRDRFELMAVDLAHPDTPVVRYRETVHAADATVSPRADLFAYGPADNESRQAPWRFTVAASDGRVVKEIETENTVGFLTTLALSPAGNVLVALSTNDVRAWRLDGPQPRVFAQPWSDSDHFCAGRVPQVTDAGALLLADCATGRLGVYAMADGLPRIAVLQTAQRGLRDEALDPNEADSGPLLFWAFDELLQIDLRDIDAPVLQRLTPPIGLTPIAAARGRLAVIDRQYRLSMQSVPSTVIDETVRQSAPSAATPAADPATGVTEPCEALADWANAGRLNELLSGVGTNLPWHGRRIDLAFTTEGTAHVPVWHGVDSATDEPVPDADLPRISGQNDLWGYEDVKLLTYSDRHYVLHDRGPQYPIEAVSLENPGDACRFEVKTTETTGPHVRAPKLCADLQAARVPMLPEQPGPSRVDPRAVMERWSESDVGGVIQTAFANNGMPFHVARIRLASGAGPGCDAEFFDLLSPDGLSLATGPARERLIALQGFNDPRQYRYPVECGRQSAFFRWQGQVYFDARPMVWPPVSQFDEYHHVTTLRGGQVLEMCDFRFRTVTTARSALVETDKSE